MRLLVSIRLPPCSDVPWVEKNKRGTTAPCGDLVFLPPNRRFTQVQLSHSHSELHTLSFNPLQATTTNEHFYSTTNTHRNSHLIVTIQAIKMRSTIIAAAAFAVGALANPTLQKRDCNDTCMTYDQATVVANNFKTLIASYSDDLANEVLTADFVDYSDSVTELINSGCTGPDALGAATFDSRASFEAGQASQPAIPFEILNMWYACEGPVVIRWRSAQTPEEVTGNIVMETTRSTSTSEPWLINTVYSEFNSGAWLVNLGVFVPNCTNGSGTAVGKRSVTKGHSVNLFNRL